MINLMTEMGFSRADELLQIIFSIEKRVLLEWLGTGKR
jgi:hypothetical protein